MAENIRNIQISRTPMPEQEARQRKKNFDEVALGYGEEDAKREASRCLHCKRPSCILGCPVNVNIPEFIKNVSAGDLDQAFEIIAATNSLPAICGRVCPQESQCEKNCIRAKKGEAVAIGNLERFVSDYQLDSGNVEPQPHKPNGHRVAIVGSGPAGLTCAGDLARNGYEVTVFEAFHKAGGVLIYGIPEFRLPKEIVAKEIRGLERYGVKIITNAVIGRSMSVDELFDDGYEAVFIGSGAGAPRYLHIPGENFLGVYSANEYLTRINLMKAHIKGYDTPFKQSRRVAVIGGGNVAIDAARCALRMGAEEVSVVYRRSLEEIPARAEEIKHALAEGVYLKLLCNPKKILGDETGRVIGLECTEMTLGEPDESGRRSPLEKPDSEFIIEADSIIIAVGTSPNPLIKSTTQGLISNREGGLVVNDKMATARKGVFAGGDAVTGAATVIMAMGAGKTAALSIMEYLGAKK